MLNKNKSLMPNATIYFWPIMYTIWMGIVNILCYYGFNIKYQDSVFLETVGPFILVLTVLTIFSFLLIRKNIRVDWDERKRYFLYAIIMLPIALATIYSWVQLGKPTKEFLIPLFVTMIVGIAEELMFRRILFVGIQKRKGSTSAIFISAIFFSALHIVNLLAGYPIKDLLMQLLMTFIAGIYYAAMYTYVKNVYLLMLEHWLWDYLVIYAAGKIDWVNYIIILTSILQIIVTIIILFKNIRKNKKNIKNLLVKENI